MRHAKLFFYAYYLPGNSGVTFKKHPQQLPTIKAKKAQHFPAYSTIKIISSQSLKLDSVFQKIA
jgi:hypothetical protein